MQDNEKKLQILFLAVVIVLFIAGCFLGKLCMNHQATWPAFNGPALGTLAIGELIWWRVRKIIMRKDHSDGRNS